METTETKKTNWIVIVGLLIVAGILLFAVTAGATDVEDCRAREGVLHARAVDELNNWFAGHGTSNSGAHIEARQALDQDYQYRLSLCGEVVSTPTPTVVPSTEPSPTPTADCPERALGLYCPDDPSPTESPNIIPSPTPEPSDEPNEESNDPGDEQDCEKSTNVDACGEGYTNEQPVEEVAKATVTPATTKLEVTTTPTVVKQELVTFPSTGFSWF